MKAFFRIGCGYSACGLAGSILRLGGEVKVGFVGPKVDSLGLCTQGCAPKRGWTLGYLICTPSACIGVDTVVGRVRELDLVGWLGLSAVP